MVKALGNGLDRDIRPLGVDAGRHHRGIRLLARDATIPEHEALAEKHDFETAHHFAR